MLSMEKKTFLVFSLNVGMHFTLHSLFFHEKETPFQVQSHGRSLQVSFPYWIFHEFSESCDSFPQKATILVSLQHEVETQNEQNFNHKST